MEHTVRNARTRVDTVLINMYVIIQTDHVLTAVRLVTKADYVKHVSRLATMPTDQRLSKNDQIVVFTLNMHTFGILRLMLLSYV